jgi:hypothetical protein
MSGCLAAAMLARYFRDRGGVAPEALQALQEAPDEVVSEMATGELQVLTDAVIEEHLRRTRRHELELA